MAEFGAAKRWILTIAGMATLACAAAAQTYDDAKQRGPSGGGDAQTVSGLDPSQVRAYRSHVEFLANPFMEGRGPDTRGNVIAAEYLEAGFKSLGLTPLIVDPDGAAGGESSHAGFRQEFTAGNNVRRIDSLLTGNPDAPAAGAFQHGLDYTALGFSASASATGPLAFVGYAIGKGGPDGSYTSFAGDAAAKTLEGKIAVLFRFEPMGEDGKSQWRQKSDGQWTAAAAIAEKINAVVRRGAVGIIIVSPPDCADPRAKKLESTEATARWMRQQEVPIVLMTPEAAERLLKTRDAQGRSIRDLRRAADAGDVGIELAPDPVTLSVELDRSPRTTWNIVGVLPGKGDRAREVVVVGAHYDHVGYGYTGGSRTDEYGVVHPGADDNASGTAGLLMAAGALKERYDRAPADANLRSIVFAGFSAEEMGLIGSRHYVKNNPHSADQTYAMINMDMIGRMRDNALEVAGTGTAEGFDAFLSPLFEASGLQIRKSPGGRGPSDHAAFYGAGVPVLHLFTGLHEEYHTPRDTIATINFEGGLRAAHLATEIAYALAGREGPLTFTSTDRRRDAGPADQPSPTMGNVKVRFGIAPANYADADPGVGVGEVIAGTSAEEAGIQKGDRLIRWNGKPVDDVEGWMRLLAEHKPGDVVDVTIKRKGEEQVVRVTLKSRDQAQR